MFQGKGPSVGNRGLFDSRFCKNGFPHSQNQQRYNLFQAALVSEGGVFPL